MIQLDGGFTFQNMYVYPARGDNSDALAYRYLPLTPRPEADSQGSPMLLSIPMETGGLLQLGTNLGVAEASVDALRLELAARLKLDDPIRIDLEPATLQVSGAWLEASGGGIDKPESPAWEVLASSDTSCFYPFTALFNVQLNADQQAAATAGLNGRPGFLQVRYGAALPIPVQTEVRIFGDVSSLLTELHALTGPPVEQELLNRAGRLLDRALEEGRLKMEKLSSGSATSDLMQRACDEARQHMLDLLLRLFAGQATLPDQTRVEASGHISDFVNYPLDLATDVATWFAGKGLDNIMLPPGS